MTETMPASAATRNTGRYAYNTATQELSTPDGKILHAKQPDNAPPLVIDPKTNRQRSVFDLLYEEYTGAKLPKNKHAVSKKTEAGTRNYDAALFVPGEAEIVTDAALHKEAMEKPGRGRKPTVNLETAKLWKSEFWGGKRTIAQLARYTGFSESTVGAIVRGDKLWYA